MIGELGEEWTMYINGLIQAEVSLSDRSDQLVWRSNKVTGNVTAKLTYNQIMENIAKLVGRWWNTWVWKAT